MILGLALIESLVIYSLLIALFLNGHLGQLVTTMVAH
jgi:F0F1-type ATP synthase membrane subunit c/vacuolar-type H+-ATPase subunit K